MTNTNNVTLSLTIVLFINLLLFLGQYSAIELNVNSPRVFDPNGTLLCSMDKDKCENWGTYTLDDEDPTTRLPSTDPSVTEGGGNWFMDIFVNIKSWFTETTGLDFLSSILSAPANFLETIGLPNVISWSLGALWHLIGVFLIISFLWGR